MKLKKDDSQPVRVSKSTIRAARANKKKTGAPIGKFIDDIVSKWVKAQKVVKSNTN